MNIMGVTLLILEVCGGITNFEHPYSLARFLYEPLRCILEIVEISTQKEITKQKKHLYPLEAQYSMRIPGMSFISPS